MTRLARRLLALVDGPLTDRWPTVVYALRPFDPLADVRRWQWQRATPCGVRQLVEVDGEPVLIVWPDDWVRPELMSRDWR